MRIDKLERKRAETEKEMKREDTRKTTKVLALIAILIVVIAVFIRWIYMAFITAGNQSERQLQQPRTVSLPVPTLGETEAAPTAPPSTSPSPPSPDIVPTAPRPQVRVSKIFFYIDL